MSTRDHPDWWKNIGGQNSQDSILERRSLVWNDNEVEGPEAPPAFYTCLTYKGKFYPRGCRGMIEAIQIYCRDAGADRLTLRYSPHPCLGPFGEVTITPLAAWSWVGAVIEEMWDYDSLFIWVYACDQGTDWAYDTKEPYDGHWSQDVGETWEDMAIRPFIRVVYTGETPGDVPVSGIINNIPIPNYSTRSQAESEAVAINVDADLIEVDGAGYCDFISARVQAAAGSNVSRIHVDIDGVRVFSQPYDWLAARGYTTATPTVSLPEYNVAGSCTMLIHKRWEFRRTFRVGVFNNVGAQTYDMVAYPALLR